MMIWGFGVYIRKGCKVKAVTSRSRKATEVLKGSGRVLAASISHNNHITRPPEEFLPFGPSFA